MGIKGDRSLRCVSKAIAHLSLCPRRSLVGMSIKGDRPSRHTPAQRSDSEYAAALDNLVLTCVDIVCGQR
ncbi:MAG: hypothetical protein ACFE0J_03505 [Elainellaceae cyanobacterium]